MNPIEVPIQKISGVHLYRDEARASSDINDPGRPIAGLLAKGLDRGPSRVTSWHNSGKKMSQVPWASAKGKTHSYAAGACQFRNLGTKAE